MKTILILNANIVNEGKIFNSDLLIRDGLIHRIDKQIAEKADITINAEGKFLLPGIIDDQVHFREPGLTHKADIYSESKAAVAGGVTSYFEMPNTTPRALTQQLLEEKYRIAARKSFANYSFYMGTSNDNIEEVLKTDPSTVCGIKIFMGSSTGNMLVDDEKTLKRLFEKAPLLIATHCEDEQTILRNLKKYEKKYGENIPVKCHPEIRSVDACFKSSSFAVNLAKQYGTRLHILHISTEEELALFENNIPLHKKNITAEVCVHHLWFDNGDYDDLGARIKCNPAIKEARHKKALLKALLDDRLDIIATDHAPHTIDEKQNNYKDAPSGIPLIQDSLNIMLEFHQQKKITLEKIAEKMCHAPAICFNINKRGFIREGFWADLVIVDLNASRKVKKENIYYKCGWSPFDGKLFSSGITHTIVSGHL
ncbi:MAG: dihydroorotase, partial [Bacteroidetes bacterium]|nr:dihydroorotase [Bacteroidota bacterium]